MFSVYITEYSETLEMILFVWMWSVNCCFRPFPTRHRGSFGLPSGNVFQQLGSACSGGLQTLPGRILLRVCRHHWAWRTLQRGVGKVFLFFRNSNLIVIFCVFYEAGVFRFALFSCCRYYCVGEAVTPTPSDGITGGPCPEGFYCPEGTVQPVPCKPGTFAAVTHAAKCEPCLPGWYCVFGSLYLCPAGLLFFFSCT